MIILFFKYNKEVIYLQNCLGTSSDVLLCSFFRGIMNILVGAIFCPSGISNMIGNTGPIFLK